MLEPARRQHLHGEGRGSKGRSEQAREARSYARYQHEPRRVLDSQKPPDPVRDGRAELHRHALASRAAAEQMRQPGCAHDKGHEPERYLAALAVARLEHHAHAALTALSVVLIRPGHGRANKAQEGHEPHDMRVPDRAEVQQHPPKEGIHGPYGDARRYGGEYEYERPFHIQHLSKQKSRCSRARPMPRAEVISSHKRFRPHSRGGPHPLIVIPSKTCRRCSYTPA